MTIRRGDVYFVDLNPVRGREQAGRRPVAVLPVDEINSRPLVVTVVIGTKGENVRRDYATNVRVSTEDSGLPLETVFLGFHVRSSIPNDSPTHLRGICRKPQCSDWKSQFVTAWVCSRHSTATAKPDRTRRLKRLP